MSRKLIPGLDDLPQYPEWVAVVKTYSKCHRLLSVRLAELDLSVAQHELLLAVGRSEGLSQRALAGRLLVGKSNVTAMLKRLGARELIRRENNVHDARIWHVHLTPAGRRLLKRSVRVQAGVVSLMTGELSTGQVAQLGAIMRTVGASLDAALGAESG